MWQGPYGVVSLIGEVLVGIKASRRSKSKVVHADELAVTRKPISMDWIKDLPSKLEYQFTDDVLPDVRRLYDGKSKGVIESSKIEVNTPILGKIQKVILDESGVDKSKVESVVDKSVKMDASQKVTRSGQMYLLRFGTC